MKKQPIELVSWETVTRDMKYPKNDNNGGLTYGIYFLGEHYKETSDIIDVEWFKTDQERQDYIRDNNLVVVYED